MQTGLLPFNVEIMDTSAARLATLKPVRSLDIYETVGGNLHEDGLFSISIFGRIGTPERMRRFSYIDIKTSILHPFIYRTLCKLKSLYEGVLTGKQYAVWNAELGDFESSDALDGDTGYHFFMSHFKDLKFKTNKSVIRDQRVALLEKYRNRAMTTKILVLPAGLRDIEVDASGRTVLGDINTIYSKILGISRTISDNAHTANSPTLDLPRHLLQMSFNALFDLIQDMLTGKRGFIQNRWAARRVLNGTRNVISAMNIAIKELGSPYGPKPTDTVLGLYQAIKAILPVTIHTLRNGYLLGAFGVGENQARLINRETLKTELVQLTSDQYDRWTTIEGIEKVIAMYREPALRDRPIIINDRYLALVYRGEGTFKVFYDIDDLPDGFDRANVAPMNLCEFIYLSGYRIWNNYAGVVTRYPITGIGSSYPTTFYVKTTVVGEIRKELDDNWQPLGDEYVAQEFPKFNPSAYVDSQIIPSHRLAGLGADFDGDTCSGTAVYSDEALKGIRDHLASKNAYVDPRGGLKTSMNTTTVALVAHNMTGKPKPRPDIKYVGTAPGTTIFTDPKRQTLSPDPR